LNLLLALLLAVPAAASSSGGSGAAAGAQQEYLRGTLLERRGAYAEALAAYRQAEPQTFSMPWPNDGTNITVLPNTFSSHTATILMSSSPTSAPIMVDLQHLSDGSMVRLRGNGGIHGGHPRLVSVHP